MAEIKSEQHGKGDPRLLPVVSDALTSLAFYGRMAGWAGSVLLLATLGWAGVTKGFHGVPIKVVGILGLVCVAFWVYSNIHQLVIAVRRRGMQSALNSALFTVFVLAILVLVNYMGGRHQIFHADLTKNKQYSLSDQTRKILKELDQKVTITAFISEENQRGEELRRLLDDYDRAAGKLDVKIYDFKTDIDKVQEYQARFDGTMYVEAGEEGAKRKEEIQGGSEEQLTSTLLAVTTGEKTRICFLTGHGEGSLESTGAPDKPSYSALKSILTNQQYQLDALNMVTMKVPAVPGDCKLLVIAGAKYAPTAKEMQAITQYVDQGGNLMLLLEPAPAPDFAELLKAHGVTPLAGTVKDPMSSAEGNQTILAAMPEQHDVTGGLQLVVLPTTTAFDVPESTPPPAMPGAPPPPSDQKAKPLLKTSEAATISGVAGRRGPFTVAVAIDESTAPPPQMPGMPPQEQPPSERKSRMIVIGDSDFATDTWFDTLGGMRGLGGQDIAFAAMGVNWLVKNEKLVSVPPKEPSEKPFSVTDSQRRFVWLLVIGIVPLLIIVGGVFIWWRRRV
jgi:hypothetical protein